MINGSNIPLSTFIDVPLVINQKKYPSFNKLSQKAEGILHHSKFSAFVFGMGDCWSGNLLVENTTEQYHRIPKDILYIDYDYAGFHPVILDLVTPFFLDIFFDVMYSHTIYETPNVHVSITDGAIHIDFKMPEDSLNSAVMEIRMRYLLEPLFVFMKGQGIDLENSLDQFESGFFLAGTSRCAWNLPNGWNEFFAWYAIGVILSQIKRLTDLRDVWYSLTLKL